MPRKSWRETHLVAAEDVGNHEPARWVRSPGEVQLTSCSVRGSQRLGIRGFLSHRTSTFGGIDPMDRKSGFDVTCTNGHESPEGAHFCMTCGEHLIDQGGVAEDVSDEAGADHVPPPPPVAGEVDDVASPKGSTRRLPLIASLAVAVLAIAGLAFVMTRPSTEDLYLAALEDEGLADEFSTKPAAVRNAEEACGAIEDGEDPVGSEADLVGVRHYCPEWEDDFSVLRVDLVDAEFRLLDRDGYETTALGCEGDGGYGDINASTSYVVTNLAGEVLTRGSIGPGEEEDGDCVFEWTFEITEGEESYIVAVGDRGEIDYTFEELTSFGVALSLGD